MLFTVATAAGHPYCFLATTRASHPKAIHDK